MYVDLELKMYKVHAFGDLTLEIFLAFNCTKIEDLSQKHGIWFLQIHYDMFDKIPHRRAA
jgi:hypothetical protein